MIGKARIQGEIRVLPTDAEVFSCFSSASRHTQDVVISYGVKYARLIFTPYSTFTVTTKIVMPTIIAVGVGGRGGDGYYDVNKAMKGRGGYAGEQRRDTRDLLGGSYTVTGGRGSEKKQVELVKDGSTLIFARDGADGGVFEQFENSSSIEEGSIQGDNGYQDNISGVRGETGTNGPSCIDTQGGYGGYGLGGGGGGTLPCSDLGSYGGVGATGAVIIMVEVR